MAIIDAQNLFSDAQAVTATAISTNVIDTSPLGANTGRDLGAGNPLYLVIVVGTAATAAGAATVTFSLESDSTADLATSATVHFTTAAIPKASLTAGAVVAAIALPVGPTANYEKFLGVRYTVATGPLTAGTFTAMLLHSTDTFRAYQDAITIS
jgi:hypothetical protein